MQSSRAMLFLSLSLCISNNLCTRMKRESDTVITDMSIEGEVERIVKELEGYGPGIDHTAVNDKLKRLYQILPEVAEPARRAQFLDRLQRLGFNFVGGALSTSSASTNDKNEQIITLLGNATALLDTVEDVIHADNYDQSYADQLITELYGVLPQIPASHDRDRLLVRAEKTGLPLPEIYLERFSDTTSPPLPPEQKEALNSAKRQEELQSQTLQHVQQAELYKRKAELAEREAQLIKEKLELSQKLLKHEEQKNAHRKQACGLQTDLALESEEDLDTDNESEELETPHKHPDELSEAIETDEDIANADADAMALEALETIQEEHE